MGRGVKPPRFFSSSYFQRVCFFLNYFFLFSSLYFKDFFLFTYEEFFCSPLQRVLFSSPFPFRIWTYWSPVSGNGTFNIKRFPSQGHGNTYFGKFIKYNRILNNKHIYACIFCIVYQISSQFFVCLPPNTH